jgi:hypothetical protein
MDWIDQLLKKECEHKHKTDLAPFTAAKRAGESHYYCYQCGAHWYKGKFWTKKEWMDWIENIE